jgi:hypothetical protein
VAIQVRAAAALAARMERAAPEEMDRAAFNWVLERAAAAAAAARRREEIRLLRSLL